MQEAVYLRTGKPTVKVMGVLPQQRGWREERICWNQQLQLSSAGGGNVGLEIVVGGHESYGTCLVWSPPHPTTVEHTPLH